MNQWTLSQSSFDAFLGNLDSDRELAGQKYEAIRTRLVKFFEWRACQFADDLADRTLDRVVRKVDSGEQINDYFNYTYAVARLVYMENLRQENKQQAVINNLPVKIDPPDENPQLNCLESCLEKLTEKSRAMILHYYRDDKQAKIDYRKKLAETFGISLNALRIKTLRIRTRLEECVFKCLKINSAEVK
jgi:DNA-directed RNA polymerase specialized sigma24 family protein